jgi:protein-S-isoprenylcysteine O-methyltransferase Ste14
MSTIQSKVPIVFTLAGLVLLAVLSVHQLRQLEGALLVVRATMLGAYLVWLVLETRVARGELGKGETRHDRGTLELYAFARTATVSASLWLAGPHAELMPVVVGALLFTCGVALRLYAISVLGRFYSHRVRLTSEHRIVADGPYAFVRHPAYSGMLVANLGLVVGFYHWASLLLWLILFVPAIVLRILVEERTLLGLPGYQDYSATRKRLVPSIW